MIRDRRSADRAMEDKSKKRSNVRAVAFGRNYFYALTDSVSYNGHDTSDADNLNADPPWKDALPLSASSTVQSTVIVTQNGKVYQTGTLHGIVYPTWTHIEIPIPLRCVQVAAGRHFCLARMEGGKAVLTWGAGHFGQLGVVTATKRISSPDDSGSVSSNSSSPSRKSNRSTAPTAKCITLATQPILIERLLPAFTGSPIQSVAAGDWHGLALTESGHVWAWGSNQSLQCGIQLSSSNKEHSVGTIALPLPISGLPPMKQVAAGRSHSVALTAEYGKVYCWGSSSAGQCGTGVSSRRSVKGLPPSPVQGLPSSLEMIQIDASGNHSISLSKAGRVFTWGDGREGQLGISIATSTSKCVSLQDHQSNKPRLVADLDFVAVAASHECHAQHGLTDENLAESKSSAAEILARVPRIVSVHAAGNSTAAVSSSGHLYCWGSNDVGQIGLQKPENIIREVTTDSSLPYNHDSVISQSLQQNHYRGRDLNLETFDSNHNVLLPTRVEAVDNISIGLLAFGPNHMMCFGMERQQEDSSVIIGRTLHEAQADQVLSQQSIASSMPKDSTETIFPVDKFDQENAAFSQTDCSLTSKLDTDEINNVITDVNESDNKLSDGMIDATKGSSNGVFLDEVTQSLGNTSLSSTNTIGAATTVEESVSSPECRHNDAGIPIVEHEAVFKTGKSNKESKRPSLIKRFSNRLLRRRLPQSKNNP